jgi:hypothetical protein
MQLDEKYIVLKKADVEAALTEKELATLQLLLYTVGSYRFSLGKPDNKYVVINQDEPYFPDVLKLMERAEEIAHIKDLQRDIMVSHIAQKHEETDGQNRTSMLQSTYDKAVSTAPTFSWVMQCQRCEQEGVCMARPSGILHAPIMWICEACWSSATTDDLQQGVTHD